MTSPDKFSPEIDDRPDYAPPSIMTLREDEILDQVGPAQAYTGNVPFGF
jgi:hypothetical protein